MVEPGAGDVLKLIGTLKISGRENGDAFEVIEYGGPAAPPPHIHREHEEGFYILEGAFTFTLRENQFDAPAGSFVFVPKGTRHGFKPTEGARALLIIVPAGLEGFFRELGDGLASGKSGVEMRAALAGKYDSHPA